MSKETRSTEASTTGTDSTVRLSVNIHNDVSDVLKEYAARKGVSVTEAVRRAIEVLHNVDKAYQDGASVNLEKDGRLKEVVFVI